MRYRLAIIMSLLTFGAHATEITLAVPDADEVETSTAVYQCGDFELSVEYVNAGPVSLAVFAVDGTTIVAANVLSGSGAKYAGSHYVWWTKGLTGDLYDLMRDEDTPPVHCSEAS